MSLYILHVSAKDRLVPNQIV